MAHDPQGLTRISAGQAARAFASCVGLDPQGRATPDSAASAGESFALDTPSGRLIYTLSMDAGGCWIHGAAGTGSGLTAAGLACIEAQARAAGCTRVAFQTVRRGLVRQAQRLGYRIACPIGRGHILEKSIQ
jgi:hypothetical protein